MDVKEPGQVRILTVSAYVLAVRSESREYLRSRYELLSGRVREGLHGHLDRFEGVCTIAKHGVVLPGVVVSELLIQGRLGDEVVHVVRHDLPGM